jgi:Cytotoxic translational repressor of toxin-antitoxin stability system
VTTGDDRRIDRPRYEIEFLPGAARQLEKLPITGRALVVVAIDGLSESPHPEGAKLLSGTSDERIWRLAVGDYRVLYQVTDGVLLVLIVRVADRREVYNPTTIRRLLKQIRGAR